jgi:hypothetical protein
VTAYYRRVIVSTCAIKGSIHSPDYLRAKENSPSGTDGLYTSHNFCYLTVIVPVFGTPSELALIVTVLALVCFVVVTVKVALTAPFLTITVAGTEAAPGNDDPSDTVTSPTGATASFTVPMALVPPTTDVGAIVTAETPGGSTLRTVDLVTPLSVPEIETSTVAATATVVIGNVIDVFPTGTITLPKTIAVPLAELVS